jgi:hypothetical protein
MRRVLPSFFLLTAFASWSSAAPPDAPKSLTAPAGKVKEFVVKADGAKKFGKQLVGGNAAFRGFPGDAPGETVFWLIPEADGPLWILWVTEGETTFGVTEVNKGVVPPPPAPPPKPVDPDVKPVDPLKSFRVIFIYESDDNLTPDQRAVVYGKAVEDFLIANCTGGKSGFRRRDKDAPGEADATFAALWAAVKPNVTVTPCVAIERNGKVTILNLEAAPAKQIETLQKYRGGN